MVKPKYFFLLILYFFKVFPGDMLLSKFCQLDPNMINVEDETLRVKVMVAIHAARACEVRRFIFLT
jgi:hypothetical protein